MKPIGYVYKTTCLVNGKIYIGQHRVNEKWNDGYIGSGSYFYKAVRKYGKKNFKREMLKICFTENQLNAWETYYTKKYNPNLDSEIGYNKCFGPVKVSGNRNPACHPDVKAKMTIKNRMTCSNPEYRKKQSERMKKQFANPEDNPFYGRKHTEETKKIISQKKIEYYKTHESPFKGKKMSEESRKKLSDRMLNFYKNGGIPHNKGIPLDEKLRKKLSDRGKELFAGSGNPNFGKFWINNGIRNKGCKLGEPIPEGWNKGMIKITVTISK